MDNDETIQQRIRERAFKLWEDAGSPDGRNEEFWHQAKEMETAQPPSGDVKTGDKK